MSTDPEMSQGFDSEADLATLGVSRRLTERGEITKIVELGHTKPPEPADIPYTGNPVDHARATWKLTTSASAYLANFKIGIYGDRNLPPTIATLEQSWLDEHDVSIQALRARTSWHDGTFDRLLLPYLSGTLSLFANGPRDIAMQAYYQERTALLSELPQDTTERANRIRSGRLTVDMARAIKQQIEALPHNMSVANYALMAPEQQKEVTDYIADQVMTFWTYATRYGDPMLFEDRAPILERPVSELVELMTYAPDPHAAFRSYILANSNESAYNDLLGRLTSARNAAKRGDPGFDRDHSPLSFVDQLRGLESGDILVLNKGEDAISIPEFNRRIDLLNDGIVAIVTDGLRGVSRSNWNSASADAAGRLLGKHAGAIKGVEIQCLPVTAEEVETALGKTKMHAKPISLERVYRYRLKASLKSSGRPELPVSVDCIVFAANTEVSGWRGKHSNHLRAHRSMTGRVEGQKAQDLWHQYSVNTGRILEVIGLLTPRSGGRATPG